MKNNFMATDSKCARFPTWLRALALGAALIGFVTPSANAQPLGLIVDPYPDAKAWNSISYTGNTTSGFHMDIDGFVTGFDDGVGISYPSGSCSGLACYTLDADFDGSGNFLGGSISILYTPTHTTAGGKNLTSGNLVTGTLTAFGFASASPHSGTSGIFEFTFDILSGDYMTVWYGTDGGTIINTIGLKNLDGSDFNTGGQSWDDYGLMTKQFMAYLDGGTQSDTFIPIPATAWLFGSGLLALAGVARRRKKSQPH